MLVMRSNESLQQLEFLFRLSEMEAKISMVLPALSHYSHWSHLVHYIYCFTRDLSSYEPSLNNCSLHLAGWDMV